jgi:hypothetical protein
MAGFPNYSSTPVQNLVGQVTNPAQTNPDNTIANVNLASDGALLVQPSGGDYKAFARRGKLYMAALTTAAGTIAINTTTSGCTWALVNPVGSGVLLEPVDFQLDQLAAGPTGVNTVGFALVGPANAISGVTKAPVPTGGLLTGTAGAFSTRLDQPAGSGYVATVITFASALTIAANWGYPLFTFPSIYLPTAAVPIVPYRHFFQGKLILPPGYVAALTSSVAWAANSATPSMSWLEYPV